MLNARKTLVTYSAMLLALTATSEALATSLMAPVQLLAQTPAPTTFPVPSSVPSGSTLAVDGSGSMTLINEALKQQFEQEFADTTVKLADSGTAAALESLVKGDIDLAAIGRPLTPAEKAEGLVVIPISREKIAIIVGSDNSYAGSLTFDQFAKIFRGEITNWSEVGGASGKIRFIDRPDTSDTRISLSNYKVFQSAPFNSGATATQVADDETATVVTELGNDGISYAIADQVMGQSNVKIVPMHKTLPDNPAYPFSQPRGYVYKPDANGQPSPIVQAFLGFATSAPGQQAVETAKEAEAAAVAVAATTGSTTATASETPSSVDPTPSASPDSSPLAASPSPDAAATGAATPQPGIPWWGILLPLLGLAGLLVWLKGRGAAPAAAPAAPPVLVPPPVAISTPRLILTPRNSQEVYAYWEVPNSVKDDLSRQGGRDLKLRLYDVTDVELERQEPPIGKEFNCDLNAQDLHVPIAVGDRDYQAELGYVTEDGRWLKVARSAHVRVPASEAGTEFVAPVAGEGAGVSSTVVPTPDTVDLPNVANGGAAGVGAVGAVAAGAAALAGAAFAANQMDEGNPHATTATDGNDLAGDAWDTPSPAMSPVAEVSEVAALREPELPGVGEMPDVGEMDTAEMDTSEDPVDAAGVDAAEMGAAGLDTVELDTVGLNTNEISAEGIDTEKINAAGIGAVGIGAVGIGAVLAGAAIAGGDTVSDNSTPDSIVFSKWGAMAGYVKWELPAHNASLREQGGRDLKLRIYDATALDLDTQDAHSVDEYAINSWMTDHDKVVPIHQGDRDYVAEVGYTTDDGRWVKLARSQHVHFPIPAKSLGDAAVVTHAAAMSGALFEGYPLTEDSVITDLVVHSRRNAFLLSAEEMQYIQNNVAAKTYLAAGIYEIKITDGTFDYQSQTGEPGEPLAILWIYGGKVMNKATNVPVMATWSTLNGYGDILTLEVFDSVTVCAFFIDTYPDDNEGEVCVSVEKISHEILEIQA